MKHEKYQEIFNANAQTMAVQGHELIIGVAKEKLTTLLQMARDFGFETLVEITAVDYPTRQKRFDVVYMLLHYGDNMRLRLHVPLAEDEDMESVVAIYPNANWCEREIYDLYGIIFTNHPDLRRIVTDYGFQGHPLRKDFPLTGHVETIYDEAQKRVVYRPVELVQDFRQFDFMSPWAGSLGAGSLGAGNLGIGNMGSGNMGAGNKPTLPGDEKAGK